MEPTLKQRARIDTVAIPLLGGIPEALSPSQRRRWRESVGIHEAGHVFAACHFGFSLQEKAAELTHGGLYGLTHFYGEDVPPRDGAWLARNRAEEAVVVLLAGGAAVRKLRNRYEAGLHLNVLDREAAKTILEAIMPSPAELPWRETPYRWERGGELDCYLTLLECRAERLIVAPENWSIIRDIATDLLRARSMTAGEIEISVRRRCRAIASIVSASSH